MIITKIEINYDVELSKSKGMIIFDIEEQTDVNQTIKGTGYKTHSGNGQYNIATVQLTFPM